MEQKTLSYSTKNIPVPNKNTYKQILIQKAEKFNRNMRWKAYFFLNPSKKTKTKNNFKFKSISPAPSNITQLKHFEEKFANMLKSIQFGRHSNHFLQQLKKDEKDIKSETKIHIKADKSNNFYKMEGDSYKKLVEKEVQKEYRKAEKNEIDKVEKTQKELVASVELQDRVFKATRQQCFSTLKDHKENLANKPTVRLINPANNEIGRISKCILDDINA